MGNVLDVVLVPTLEAILMIYDIVPFSNYFKYKSTLFGLIKLAVHRAVLDKRNLYKAPLLPVPPDRTIPKRRSDDGFGTDPKNPTTAMTGAPIGRNIPALPKHLRDPHGKPGVQMVANHLLAREGFKPAGSQLNIVAASWIQAMVHDWIGHLDSNTTDTLEAKSKVCPFAKSPFRFKTTQVRKDGFSLSERSQWWDASFVYGNDSKMVNNARTKEGGKMKVNKTGTPHLLPENADGTYTTGDNRNSWVGVALLQELFVREHNWIADKIAEENPRMSDQEIFDTARLIVAALVAKIHTVDWTVELLKTELLRIGMETNWYGLPKALFGKWFPSDFLAKVGQDKADNKGTPFCLTEEFAAVYRLHSLSPPGLVVGKNNDKFVELIDLVGDKGRAAMKETTDRPMEMMKSCLSYPCGGLLSSNYPNAFRNVAPTNELGKSLPETENIDLAAIDLYRDRERGIQTFNDFRRALNLKPYRSWMELTGNNEADARKLELIYGPGQAGIERLDLLVGDMYEKKPEPSFALSETSFIIFLLMASRRLDSDPFLNEKFTEEYYTKFGLSHVKATDGLLQVLERHYPLLAADFKDKKGNQKQSAFKPTLGPQAWKEAEKNLIPQRIVKEWADTKEKNETFFDELEQESKDFYENIKSDGETPTSPQWFYVIVSVLLFVIPIYIHQNFADTLGYIGVRKLWPVDVDVARELAYSNVRHHNTISRIYHLFTNPLIYASQVYLMNHTPSLFKLGIDFNAAGIYFAFLAGFSLLSEWITGIGCVLWLGIFYKLAVGSFDNWLTRLVGDENKFRIAFVMYCFCQFSQIIAHNIFENYYDWNLFQLFIIQQQITVYNVIKAIGVYPSFSEKVEYWEPSFAYCLEHDNDPINCGL